MISHLPISVEVTFVRHASMQQNKDFETILSRIVNDHQKNPKAFSLEKTIGPDRLQTTDLNVLHRGRIVLSVPSVAGWPFAGQELRYRSIPDNPITTILNAVSEVKRSGRAADFEEMLAAINGETSCLLLAMDPDLHIKYRQTDGSIGVFANLDPDDGLISFLIDPAIGSDDDSFIWHPPASLSGLANLCLKPSIDGKQIRLDMMRSHIFGTFTSLEMPDPIQTIRVATRHSIGNATTL